MNISESILLAIDSVRKNKLRAILTLLSISIGVFAIIGAGTLVSSMDNAVTNEMASLGENTFIIKRVPSVQMGNTRGKYRRRRMITYSVYKDFRKKMTTSNLISAESSSGGQVIKAGNHSTDPDVSLTGADEYYFVNNNISVDQGRAFTAEDITFNRNVAIIGNDILVKVFPNENPIGKRIAIQNQSFTVIGILETKGAVLGQSQDNQVIVPISKFLKHYASWWSQSVTISIKALSKELLEPTVDEAIGIMRTIRKQKPWEDNSFEVETNESIAEQFKNFTSFLSVFGVVSGVIALIAAGVGIMNIMLVSVKERTREIGIRKAIGAKRAWILAQFIIETITLCQLGGAVGIVMGIAAGNVLGKMLGMNIVFPLDWVILGIVVCTVLGVVAGSYPAWKAAKLDPIDALRYE
ncbi:MAG: FtsX-like permease family protein [Ignavibacteria bacterium]|nr:FtsX-like permease family protein [Ignavibacteria bacterium]